ncbi:saccharopine dehydrogenase family protein [Rhodococcus phenolicus]|uniref:saccharopine dehydrogenase family protein n=1 Tax=Rhodococcus phenolicus TaxID=263849 RepID=UPI00082E667F|nr:saccharopine dehydrogenase NADP-binding domain-containing protein [Rhodococcus phenolicus]
MTDREFDLVLYGATGFSGGLTAHHLATAAPAGARIALAGRSLDKLETVRAALPAGAHRWPLLHADSTDPASLNALAARTKVVATTVGPYIHHGAALVQACAHAGTHYTDLTGEPLFVRNCIDQFHDLATETGAKIVHSCGFDSIPSDLSVYQLHRRAIADNAGELTDTTLVASLKGSMSGGTIASLRAMLEAAADPASAQVLSHPYSLTPDKTRDPTVGRQNDHTLQRASTIDTSLHGWVATFPMAQHNTKIVRRSNALLGWEYGEKFRYREVMSMGTSRLSPVYAAAASGGVAALTAAGTLLSRIKTGRRLLDRALPKPGTGPSETALRAGWFTMKTFADTTTGTRYKATFAAAGDPYHGTAIMLGEAALTLAFDTLPTQSGILTPAAAMGDALTTRLHNADGFTIQITPTTA